MPTDVMPLSEYADLLADLAESWEGEEPAVLIGDIAADNLSIRAHDGYTQYGPVGYSQECFDGNGVMKLNEGDTRFFGTMLFSRDLLSETAQQEIAGGDE